MAAPDAEVNGTDYAQRANMLERNIQGTALESSFRDKLRKMISRNEYRVIVDLGEVLQHSPEMQRQILQNPREQVPVWEKYAEKMASEENPDFMQLKSAGSAETEMRKLHVGFEGQLGTHLLNPRTLRSHHLNKLVAIDGIVTKVGLVHPKLERLVQYCEATGSMEKPKNYHDETSLGQNRTSNAIVQKDAQNNQLTVEYGLSRFKNHQKIHLQEMPENAELGTVPRDITVLLDHDLVDCCKPGDRVRITGIFMAISQGQQGQSSGVFPTFIYALNARSIGRTMTKIMPSQEDIKNIKIIAHRPDAFDVLSRSLANSIHGHDNIKKGLLLLLLGGQEKNLASGLHLRGDINILLVGDPSTAKSQLLRFVINTAPLAISTSGRGSSGVGLTAAVTHSDGEPKLEAGAMVLADRGVVCIDEFDKMLPNDRVAIHEIMEQQTVTINKAGIHASLNARCSVFAAANPVYGTYDKSRSATANIGLEDSILSRFDLLFVVLDSQTPERDRRIADHVLRSHRYREDASAGASLTRTDDANDALLAASNVNSEPVTSPVWSNTSGAASVAGVQGEAADSILTTEFMKKFIYYARTRTEPSLTAEARDAIAHAYSDLRANSASYGARMSLPITPRTLESIIRLSTAYARCSLSKFITQAHVLSALGLLRSALFGDVEQARPPSSSESESEDDDDDSGGGAATRTPTRTPAKGGAKTPNKTPKKTPKSVAAERTPVRSTRSSLVDDLPTSDAFEFRPEVDAPLETPGRRMRPSPRATASSPASGSRRPSSSILQETPSPAKRARGAAASPAKALPSSASEVDFQDFKQKLARQYQSQRVEKLSFSDVFQVFQGRYSEQDVRVSLAKMCAEGILFEEQSEDGSILFHIL